jgi:hypothetical protein
MKLKKKELEYLGKVFESSELDGFPFQSKNKIMKTLEEKGMIEFCEKILPPDKQCRFPMSIKGWMLTLRGHITFCESCRDIEEEL